MLHRHKYLFKHKKTSYKKLLAQCTGLLLILIVCVFIHLYIKRQINLFITDQQNFLYHQGLELHFKSTEQPKWYIWPQTTLAYPRIQRTLTSQIIWQAKEAEIFYSLRHPLSISIKIDGEQLVCPMQEQSSCFQLHGSSWKLYLPLFSNNQQHSVYIQCPSSFYKDTFQSGSTLQSLQFKNIQATLNWNMQTNQRNSIAFSELHIAQILINIANLPPQHLQNIHAQAAVVKNQATQSSSNDWYKILIQKTDFSWNDLFLHSTGKLYINTTNPTPTGELSLQITGIHQAIYQQIMALSCCNKLKEELSQTSLPSQINLSILIREGTFYLGAIPLETIWYDQIKSLVKHYTK